MSEAHERGRRRTASRALWLVLAMCGCGDGGTSTLAVPPDAEADAMIPSDADPSDAGSPDTEPLAPPACAPLATQPAPPRDLPCAEGTCGDGWPNLGGAPCPTGWRAEPIAEARGHVCWPPPLAADCARPDAFGGCADDCAGEPAPGAVHVAPGGPEGDGSPGRPLTDLRAALAEAPRGQTFHLAPGTYAGGFDVPAGVTLRGGCGGEVVLTGSADESAVRLSPGAALVQLSVRGEGLGVDVPPARDPRDPPVSIDDIEITGGQVGLRVQGPTRVRRVLLERIEDAAILVGASSLTADDVVVRHAGGGLRALGSTVSLRDARLDHIATLGIYASDGASVTLDRVGMQGVGMGTAPDATVGLLAFGVRTTVTAHHLTIDQTIGPAVIVGRDAVLGARDLNLRDIGAPGAPVRGLGTQSRGVAEVQRGYVGGVVGSAITSTDAGSRSVLRDVLINDMSSGGVAASGVGAWANHGGAVQIVRGRLSRYAFAGALATEDATLALDGVIVGPALADAQNGMGVVGQPGGRITIERSVITGATTFGVWLAGTATARLADLRVADVRPHGATEQLGVGLLATDGVDVQLERVQVARIHRSGVHLRGARLSAHDLDIEGVQVGVAPADDAASGPAGVGLTVAGGQATLRRARVAACHGVAVAILADGELEASDLAIQGTRGAPCTGDACVTGAGDALAVGPGGTAAVTRLDLGDNDGVDVWRACAAVGLTIDGARFAGDEAGRATDAECDWAEAAEALCGEGDAVARRASPVLPTDRLLPVAP